MKKHTVIKQEINDNGKRIQELQELIKGKEQNEKMLIKAYEDKHNCSPFQARREMKKLDSTLEEIQNEIIQLHVEIENLNQINTVLLSNYQYAVYKTVMPVICEAMNKYLGKRVGEKTTDKIRNEVYEKTGFRFFWSHAYSTYKISISLGSGFSYNNDIVLYVTWNNVEYNHPGFFEEELTEDKVRFYDNYVEDVESYVNEMKDERQQLKQAMENLNKMIERYNAKCVGNMHHYASYFDR